ncbi:hypothetical protein [Nocardia jiangxiensis]|uniref:Uncharacterized protein n=1 Tax=Nocardia jiangxiensis TaxID=282685 RepID=A0ABW6S3L1_9NOCA|nr:hypothetical protein [Nocardia jiangxiensis]
MQYKVTLTPQEPTLTVKVSADSAEQFTATVTDLSLTHAEVEPDGKGIDKVLEAAAKPLVQALVNKLVPSLIGRVKGQKLPCKLDHPVGYRVKVQDVPIWVQAANLTLGTHETHLLATGEIEVRS